MLHYRICTDIFFVVCEPKVTRRFGVNHNWCRSSACNIRCGCVFDENSCLTCLELFRGGIYSYLTHKKSIFSLYESGMDDMLLDCGWIGWTFRVYDVGLSNFGLFSFGSLDGSCTCISTWRGMVLSSLKLVTKLCCGDNNTCCQVYSRYQGAVACNLCIQLCCILCLGLYESWS